MQSHVGWCIALAITICPAPAASQPDPPPEDPASQEPPEPAPPAQDPVPVPLPSPEEHAPIEVEPPPPSKAAEPPSPPPRCEGKWVARVYKASHRSVVKIDSGGGLGAGFVYPTRNHVATALHVVALGHPITVTLVTGKSVDAKIVAYDRGNDLAILELAEPVQTIDPLELTDDPVAELGAPVVAIGHPYGNAGDAKHRGLLGWSVSQGIVSGSGPSLIQTDAALNPGNSGGPVLGCDGRVLGVASAKARGEGVGFAVSSVWLRKLTERIGHQSDYGGQWQLSLSGGMTFHGNPREGLLGFDVGVSLIAADRWFGTLMFEQLWDVLLPEQQADVFEHSRSRAALGLTLGRRWLLLTALPISYVSVGVGGVVARDGAETVRVAASIDPSCAEPGCPVVISSPTSNSSHWFAWPSVVLGAQVLGPFDVSYSFLPDVVDLERSVHRGTLGLAF